MASVLGWQARLLRPSRERLRILFCRFSVLASCFDHSSVSVLDVADCSPHTFAKRTVVDGLCSLLASTTCVSLQLVLSVSAVVHPDRLKFAVHLREQHDGVVHDVAPHRLEVDVHEDPGSALESPPVGGAHTAISFCSDTALGIS